MDASYNTGSQLERAIAAYLTAVPIANVYPGMGVTVLGYPNVVVKAHTYTYDPVNTGYEIWQVQIQIQQSAADNVGAANQDGDTWVALNALVGLVKAALLQTVSGVATDISSTMAGLITVAGNALYGAGTPAQQANNIDMDSFTCINYYYKGGLRGPPEEEGASWAEIINLECHAMPATVD